MKKIFTLFVLVVNLAMLCAQQTYTESFDSLFANVSKAEATTGLLYDRVVSFAGLTNFNSLETDVDTSSANHFVQAYSELSRSVVNPSVNQEFSMETNDLRESLKNISYIPIGIINAQYDSIDIS